MDELSLADARHMMQVADVLSNAVMGSVEHSLQCDCRMNTPITREAIKETAEIDFDAFPGHEVGIAGAQAFLFWEHATQQVALLVRMSLEEVGLLAPEGVDIDGA